MLFTRIIPCLDVNRGRVVKGVHFQDLRDAGDPVAVARRYEADGADELVFLDISASHEGRAILLDMVRRVAEEVFMPFTVGGGIRTLDDATRLIQAGAEKVSLNSAAVQNPELINEISRKFGRCATVVNIDPKRVFSSPSPPGCAGPESGVRGENAASPLTPTLSPEAGKREKQMPFIVHINGGRTPTDLEAVSWAQEAERRGAGEIILTSMDADGTKNGYDLEMTAAVAAAVNIPVVASGGAGCPQHLVDAVRAGASAVLAASIFHFNEHPVPACKRFLAAAGVPVRL